MTELTYLLERNLRIRRLVREALPQPSAIDVDEVLGKVEELFDLFELELKGNDKQRLGMDDLPNILKVKAALTLLTEEIQAFLIRKAMPSP